MEREPQHDTTGAGMAATHYLSGYGEFEDKVEHLLVGGLMEFYVDEKKAIFRVANPLTPTQWDESIHRRPSSISVIRNQICMLREVSGVQDLGDTRIPDDILEMCIACGGVGWYEDQEGNQITCTVCDGEGRF